jgi:hypothetical protein
MEEVIQYVTAIISAASIIAAVTPSKKDNAIIAKIRTVIELLALNILNAKGK